MVFKAHKIPLRTKDKQKRWFRQQCGYARFAYNHALSLADRQYELTYVNTE